MNIAGPERAGNEGASLLDYSGLIPSLLYAGRVWENGSDDGDGGVAEEHEIRVRVTPRDSEQVNRVFRILTARINERYTTAITQSSENPRLVLNVEPSLAAEAFRIREDGRATVIEGGSPLGLLYGVGKFLRTSRFEGAFTASPWRGVSAPRGSLRGMYFATHFHNWYHVAPENEITRYVEDMALWGVNAIKTAFPFINLRDWEDPETEHALTMTRKFARTARDLGLKFAIGINNTMFSGAPSHTRAVPLPDPTHRRGNSGHPVCPSNPEGRDYLLANARRLFEELSGVGLDLVTFWPYDEGGCACDRCSPWGCNGFLRLSHDFTELAREHFPNIKTVLSTWMFDTPPEGEWEGLTEALKDGNNWVDYILADAHEDFPRYPLDVGVPGNLPLVNFPEISMWGNWPWGGVGANPLPARFQRLWDQVKHIVRGGFPYSEGIYEDMNKAIVAQFYWTPERSARDTLREYIAYEFGDKAIEETVALVEALEMAATRSYTKQLVDVGLVRTARELADKVHEKMPAWARTGWRWEILRLRAILDHERFAGEGFATSEAERALERLIEIYHCEMETDDPYHHRVRPPLARAVSRRGNL